MEHPIAILVLNEYFYAVRPPTLGSLEADSHQEVDGCGHRHLAGLDAVPPACQNVRDAVIYSCMFGKERIVEFGHRPIMCSCLA